ncbi:prepilin-type N-terminal cleavage/methylation domain-containing protein [Acinetobacter corruptisaponis]|uniref:Prepilin-type N-terminal cleavage/methylation domain-containing protein n=1 Tax=Acinetobacter corruptisaponis TaxID=3045147 RepID=A0ABY8S276_9GAMM|nr:prepilin-type N-terminal cleavage/methylation domain-containing protein [Acinetobacter sp. KCTC 92772]WHP04883.1 prepilin-type N-terminal cleavage/methylation domain-containing protein [Acinetobacter sp. KCTC 92772]
MEDCMQQVNNKAFTLVELIVTIAILAIIMVIAAPSFATAYTRQKLDSSARELVMKVAEAQTKAVGLRDTTVICLDTLSKQNCLKALIGTDPDANDVDNDYEKNKERIFIASLDQGVTADSLSISSLKFRKNGSLATAANFVLVRNGLSYCIKVGITGDTSIKEGACT